MRRPHFLLLLLLLLGLAVGWGSGSFLTRARVIRMVENVPASPIVLSTTYDTATNSLGFAVLNPGLVPLRMESADFIFTPGTHTQEPAYVVNRLPLQTELPPQAVTTVIVPLKEGAALLQEGDVVLTTLAYTHPLADALYTVIAAYTQGASGENATPPQTESAVDTLVQQSQQNQ